MITANMCDKKILIDFRTIIPLALLKALVYHIYSALPYNICISGILYHRCSVVYHIYSALPYNICISGILYHRCSVVYHIYSALPDRLHKLQNILIKSDNSETKVNRSIHV